MKSFVCVAHLDGCDPSVTIIQAQSNEQAEVAMQQATVQRAVRDGYEEPEVYVDSVDSLPALREKAVVAKNYSGEKTDENLFCLVYASTDDGVELVPVYAASRGRAAAMYRNRIEFLSINQPLSILMSYSGLLAL